ncbi:MAG: twin-arginine translocation pathway signal protein [Anaerolinea sp.]|nr:twin-arginine translocation pathway signal protein [Anaerolinea sp.]
MFNRRDFVKGGVALVSIGTTAQSLLKGSVAFAAQHPNDVLAKNNGKILVLVQMAGGNDGLNTLPPIGDAAYRSARKIIGVADDAILPLEGGYGLHPNLSGLKTLWGEGRLAVVRGVGYPQQDYSHFKSMAIWQAGDPELKLQDGWLGRTLEKMESEQHDPFKGFNIGTSTPPEMRIASIPIPSVNDPADYNFAVGVRSATGTDPRTATLMKLYEQYPAASPYGVLLETTVENAVTSAKQLAEVAKTYVPAVVYPETSFASGLSVLAEAIVGNLGMRVGHVTLGGFDTHSGQVEDHDRLMTTLDEGLTAFYRDLAAHGKADDVLVLTWSEFGRRVQENASGGSDHGSASVMFALGNGVQKGLYGDAPSLSKLIDNGNLSFTTDFRSVYATVMERWLGVPSEAILGKNWDQVGFIRAA